MRGKSDVDRFSPKYYFMDKVLTVHTSICTMLILVTKFRRITFFKTAVIL